MTFKLPIHPLQTAGLQFEIPEKFTFPFYYEPHALSILAANEVKKHIQQNIENIHDFKTIGKMFGVLVVQNQQNELCYLTAFSGKLADSNDHAYFVPPVFDMLQKDGHFLAEEAVINQINTALERLLEDPSFLEAQHQVALFQKRYQEELTAHKKLMEVAKKNRKQLRRVKEAELEADLFLLFCEELNQESIQRKITLKQLNYYWKNKIEAATLVVQQYQNQLEVLRNRRKQQSKALQTYLFQQYQFLNALGNSVSILDLFEDNPPAGAGECAAPKLLQFAYIHQLKPICMAEFWWGASPKSAIRKHEQFYPACQSKCNPILTHMLKGLLVADNPLLVNPAADKDLPIVYEDEYLLLVDKPAEFLSVPGKNITDSVYSRMKAKYPTATGPLVVHRLDMSTSGLLLVAKSKEVYEKLQQQFIKRTIQKRYVALLDGVIEADKGKVELPLRVDLDDRPRQMVCYEHGKKAVTVWEKISVKNSQTKVYFYPHTGRTHQLRMHAAHCLGLNAPIVGDDLYGVKRDRLCLHAEQLVFQHPVLLKEVIINSSVPF